MTLSMDLIRDLAVRRPGTPVLSVYVRTDPRDPANTATPPGWLVELRNGLREVSRTVEEADARGQRLALRDLRERVERELVALRPAERGRGLAWFVTADGALDQRFTLQLPPHGTLVRWDDYPFVSPLADVADQGRPTGLVLVSAEAIRLLHWQDGRVAPSLHGRCMRSSVANGVTMTPMWDIPAGHPRACTSRSSTSGWMSGGGVSCAALPRRWPAAQRPGLGPDRAGR